MNQREVASIAISDQFCSAFLRDSVADFALSPTAQLLLRHSNDKSRVVAFAAAVNELAA